MKDSSQQKQRRSFTLIGAMVLLFIPTFFFPQLFAPLFAHLADSYIAIHSLFEMASIFISFSIALYGWVSLRHTQYESATILSAFFLSVAVLDTFHLLTFTGMPYFFGAGAQETTTWFWTLARLTEGLIFLLSIIVLNRKKELRPKWVHLSVIAYIIGIVSLVLWGESLLPSLLNDTRPNGLKIFLEALVSAIHLIVICMLVYRLKKQKAIMLQDYFIASVAIFLSSFFFMHYENNTDFTSLIGHIYKVIGYMAIMRFVFMRNIEEPFHKIQLLHERNRGILNTVDIGMIETDSSGLIRFMNIPARMILNTDDDQAVGMSIYAFNPSTVNVHDFSLMNRHCGETFQAEVERFPLMEKGRVTGYVFTLRDLTDAIHQEKMELEKKQMDFEVKTAVTVQNSLLNSTKYAGQTNVGAISVPYRDLNGDFYSVSKAGDYTLFAIADVSGKGIPAAIQMSMITYAMEQINPFAEKPDEILRSLNRFVCRYSSDSNFITMFLCFFNEKTGKLSYSSGGHEPALLYRAATGKIEELQSKGAGLGFIETAAYETGYVQLDEGDLVVLYTDGISEDRGRNEIDSPELIMEAITETDRTRSVKDIASDLLCRVQQKKIAKASDDQTIVVLKKTGS